MRGIADREPVSAEFVRGDCRTCTRHNLWELAASNGWVGDDMSLRRFETRAGSRLPALGDAICRSARHLVLQVFANRSRHWTSRFYRREALLHRRHISGRFSARVKGPELLKDPVDLHRSKCERGHVAMAHLQTPGERLPQTIDRIETVKIAKGRSAGIRARPCNIGCMAACAFLFHKRLC